jgi:hypothetical protein
MKTTITNSLRPFVFFILIVNVSGRAQVRRTREKYFTAGFNAGVLGFATSKIDNPLGSGLTRCAAVLFSDNGRNGGNTTMLAVNSSFGVNGGFLWKDKNTKNYTGIQVEFQRNRASYVFKDPYSSITERKLTNPQDNDADDTITAVVTTYDHWGESDSYFKYSVALQRFWYRGENSMLKGDSYFYLKESFGQTFLHRNMGKEIKVGNNETAILKNDYSVNATTIAYNPVSYMLATEVGIRAFSPDKDRALDIGLVCYTPFNSTYKREYDFYKDNALIVQTQSTFSGCTVLLNASYTFNSKMKERAIDSTKLGREKIDLLAKTHTENGRNFIVQEKIALNSDLVTAKIWDRGTVDGDIVSIYLNGEEILDNFTTSKTKKEITLHLKPGENYLVMYAVNLGRVPPNTACIEIEDGSKHKSITINSDMRRSGALEISYKPALQ